MTEPFVVEPQTRKVVALQRLEMFLPSKQEPNLSYQDMGYAC